MDNKGTKQSSKENAKMTEGKALVSSNGDARRKSQMARRKSPRRFGRRVKSSEVMGEFSPPSSPRPLSDSEEMVPQSSTTSSSRSNSRKRSLGRLFRRSSPLARTRSLSASRKGRSKSSDACKTGKADIDVSYRTFDPRKMPRGRLRKMTVQEARAEQKQRLLDSVNQLPIYNTNNGDSSELFRPRSGTSSSLPDIASHFPRDSRLQDVEERQNNTSLTADNSPTSGYSPKVGKAESQKSKDDNSAGHNSKSLKTSVKKGATSTEERKRTGNKKHSEKGKSSSKKPNQKTKKVKNKNDSLKDCDTSLKKSEGDNSSLACTGVTQGNSVSSKNSDDNVGDDISKRRKESRAKFLSLSQRSPSQDSSPDETNISLTTPVSKYPLPKNRSPPPSYFESQRTAMAEALTPTDVQYKSPRRFGRSESAHVAPKAVIEDLDAFESATSSRLKRSRSEGKSKRRVNQDQLVKKENISAGGSNKSEKYKRTFSPTRKQNEQEVSQVNGSPTATTNKYDTLCNKETTEAAVISDFGSQSPVASESVQSPPSSPNTENTLLQACNISVSAENRGLDSPPIDNEPTDCRQNRADSFRCKVVIETPKDEDSSNTNDVPQSPAHLHDVPSWSRLSPDSCQSPSDEELFFDADDSLESSTKDREKDTLFPGSVSPQRGSLVVDDIPFIEEAPNDTGRDGAPSTPPDNDNKKGGKLSFKALVLVKRLSRRSKTVRRKKKTPSPHSSLPDVRIEDYDNKTNQLNSDDKALFLIENESGARETLKPYQFDSGKTIDEKSILKKELQFEPVVSDDPIPGEENPSIVVPDLARRRESKYYRLTEKRRKVVTFCKRFAAFLFSHIGLISLVVAYSIMGGFLFRAIEGPNEQTHRNDIRKLRDNAVFKIREYAVLVQIDKLDKSNFSESVDSLLKDFQTQIYLATKEKGWDGDDSSLDSLKQWSYASSLLYAITVMTTIGYGHVAPITGLGRLVTIGYAVLGIPLTLLCLTNMGDLMADGFRLLYGKVCCGLCCLCFQRHGRRLPDPEKGESHVTTDEEEEIDKPKEVIHVPTSLCMLLIVGYILAGAFLFSLWEKWDYLTGSYFCFITLSTIGFGDIVPGMEIQSWSQQEKLVLCTLYLVIGLSLLAMCFTLVQEDVKAKCRWLGEKIGIIEKEKQFV